MKAVVYKQEITTGTTEQLTAENTDLRQRLLQTEQHNQSLKSQLDWFKRQLFGVKSEKRVVVAPGQMDIADLLGMEKKPSAHAPTEKITYIRRQPKRRADDCATDVGLRFDKDVPVKVINIAHPALQGADATEYQVIDQKISRRLAQRPGSYVVLEYRRPVVKHIPTQQLSTAPLPLAVLDKSLADVSLLAGLLVDKFTYHLPLYRQHQRMVHSGITLSRTTLTHWVKRAIDLLTPIYQSQHRHILLSRVLAMDETPIRAGREKPGKMHQGWLWPIYGECNEICFTYSPTRGTQHIESQLDGFKGVLLTDGYAAYDSFAKNKMDITQAQCWAHARRYFVRAETIEPEAVTQALEHIAALYGIEKDIRNQELNGAEKLDYRIRHARSLADSFFDWCRQQQQRIDLVKSNPLTKALIYVANHQEQMRVYLSDPDVAIDTNHVERNLRAIPMGRKNWNFAWTEVGAAHVGIIQSLLTTCSLHGINPHTYLVDVLQRIDRHPASRVAELTPRVWKEMFAKEPLRSALYDHDD
jgi:transposase